MTYAAARGANVILLDASAEIFHDPPGAFQRSRLRKHWGLVLLVFQQSRPLFCISGSHQRAVFLMDLLPVSTEFVLCPSPAVV